MKTEITKVQDYRDVPFLLCVSLEDDVVECTWQKPVKAHEMRGLRCYVTQMCFDQRSSKLPISLNFIVYINDVVFFIR